MIDKMEALQEEQVKRWRENFKLSGASLAQHFEKHGITEYEHTSLINLMAVLTVAMDQAEKIE